MKGIYTKKSILIGLTSFITVLLAMPIGHALMILMELLMPPTAMHYAAFAMGAVGLVMVIIGIYVKGNTQQTLWGLFGGLLFWTGWIEFMYVYYAARFDVKPMLDVAGKVITKPEYAIMPSSFGFWVMFMILYLFNAKTGCDFFIFLQKKIFRHSKVEINLHPLSPYTSIVMFMEVNTTLWTCYLLLLFCYDNNFIGIYNPVTFIVAFGSLIGSLFMFRHLLKINTWGYAIRYAFATVVVFWNFVEILGKWNFFKEIWLHPVEYRNQMIAISSLFLVFVIYLIIASRKRKKLYKSKIST